MGAAIWLSLAVKAANNDWAVTSGILQSLGRSQAVVRRQTQAAWAGSEA